MEVYKVAKVSSSTSVVVVGCRFQAPPPHTHTLLEFLVTHFILSEWQISSEASRPVV